MTTSYDKTLETSGVVQIDAAEARKWEEASSFKELAYGGGEESTP